LEFVTFLDFYEERKTHGDLRVQLRIYRRVDEAIARFDLIGNFFVPFS
jgi:hypothetical protein